MVSVIIIRNTYGGDLYLRKGCFYVTNHQRAYAPGGHGVDYTDAYSCYDDMVAVKRYYGKTSDNPLLHIVVSYDYGVKDIETASELGKRCARYFDSQYQNVFCTHEADHECSFFHTHIIVNSVSYKDGKLISSWYGYMQQFCQFVAYVTNQKPYLTLKNKANDFED